MKRIILCLSISLWFISARSQNDSIAPAKNHGVNYKYINGVYDGVHDANGMRQGFANAVLDNGETYKGNWKDNMRDGSGKAVFPR